MRQYLLVLYSWAILIFGVCSFTSCSDDDDNDEDKSSELTPTEIYQKYINNSKAIIDGDNVVFVYEAAVTVYYFDGDKVEYAIVYADCVSSEQANEVCEKMKSTGQKYVQTDGRIVYYPYDEELLKPFRFFNKEGLCLALNTNLPNTSEDEDLFNQNED